MRHRWLIAALFVGVVLGTAFLAGVISYLVSNGSSGMSSSVFSGEKVGIVTAEGFLGSADDLVQEIEDLRKDDDIASVVLRIDSPGGSVGAAQEILEAVQQLASKKPVVASMGSVAASGGYYIACGATRILANPGTVTGSIGVRMDHLSAGDLLKWAKLNHETLTSGKFKDMTPFDRPIAPEERSILEGLLAELHEQFKSTVATSRNLDRATVDEIADGRVYTGQKALELGLVDELGGLASAIKVAAELGGIKGEPTIEYPHKKGPIMRRLLEGATSLFSEATGRSPWQLDYWQPVMALPAGLAAQ